MGRHSSAREVSSQEVNNNSKQNSNKRGPSDVSTLKRIVYPPVRRSPVENIRAHVKYGEGHVRGLRWKQCTQAYFVGKYDCLERSEHIGDSKS